MLNRNGQNNQDGSFDWKNALIDAGISCGITACSAGAAMVATGDLFTLKGALIFSFAVLGQFFGFLAIKRGLRPKEPR